VVNIKNEDERDLSHRKEKPLFTVAWADPAENEIHTKSKEILTK